jgi:creatinine amidohydrolase
LCTWQEVETYLKRSTGIIVPIGSTEQHGPNGLIGTDAICPETVANGVAERLEVLVAPTLSIGMAQHHMAFPGTISFRPSTLIAVIRDVVGSLARHGFERFYFLNGHGGNIATITAAFSEIYADQNPAAAPAGQPAVRCRLANWYMGPGVRKLSKELYGDAEGRHATPSEVSLSYYAYPNAVKTAEMSPKIAPVGEIRDAADYRRRFPDGRIGSDPSLASVEHGEQLFRAAVADVAEDYQAFLTEA